MTLTLSELRLLTKSMRFKKIRSELNNLDIPYRTLKDGMPIVLRSDVEKLSLQKVSQKQHWQPNF